MAYGGGPFVDFGVIITLSDCAIGPLNIPYSRVSDGLQVIVEKAITSEFVPSEWWLDYDGNLYLREGRGSDKSTSVFLEAGDQIGGSKKEQISKQSTQRVKVTGRGESAEQDRNTSGWHEDTDEEDNINSFYEKVEAEKTLSSKVEADVWAQVLLAQNAPARNEITVILKNDPYTADNYDLGDEVTVTDPATGLSGKYRVKTIEKWINDDGGETVLVTVSKRRTDIADRLSDLFKVLERMKHSSTYLDNLYAEGGKQTQLDPNKVEDVWEQTASNKWATDLPEDEADEDEIEFCAYAGRGAIAWGCDKEEFHINANATNAAGDVFLFEPLLKFSRDPRFTCEFEIETDEYGTTWANNAFVYFRIKQLDTLCGGGDPTNPNKHCCTPFGTPGFGFYIKMVSGVYELNAWLDDGVNVRIVKVANLAEDVKYIMEARMEWNEKIVKYYWGKSDVDKTDPTWGFRLRAILPITRRGGTEFEGDVVQDEGDLCPFHVTLDDPSSNGSRPAIVIYRWKNQAIRAVEARSVAP